jgi:flavin reductase (DIM6/NTAB) family NADH-FMN oxidoreductase RutF
MQVASSRPESARTVEAPCIAGCLVNVGCRLEWKRPLREGSGWRLMVGRVLHIIAGELRSQVAKVFTDDGSLKERCIRS